MTTNGRGLVIVTGASSGIGEAIALHQREGGFSVLAGVRRDEDSERLRTRGLTPIRLDCTVPEQLAAARAEVGDRPLAGLVNNAGILRGGPLEFVSIDDLREQLEVNVVGQVAVTQALMLLVGLLCVDVTHPVVVVVVNRPRVCDIGLQP
jgi:NAD(P)-dependent dehydrogenase (short-subunit alcohol dehydrogenase family)